MRPRGGSVAPWTVVRVFPTVRVPSAGPIDPETPDPADPGPSEASGPVGSETPDPEAPDPAGLLPAFRLEASPFGFPDRPDFDMR